MNLNKGISTPIAILLIIAVSVIVGVIIWQFATFEGESTTEQPGDYTSRSTCEEAGYYWHNNECYEEKQVDQVTITTDKQFYETGTPARIIVKNEIEESVYLKKITPPGRIFYLSLERHGKVSWKEHKFMNYPKPQYYAQLPKCIKLEPDEHYEISTGLTFYDSDRQLRVFLPSGKYRFKLKIGRKCEKDSIKNVFSVYSNPFKIKGTSSPVKIPQS